MPAFWLHNATACLSVLVHGHLPASTTLQLGSLITLLLAAVLLKHIPAMVQLPLSLPQKPH